MSKHQSWSPHLESTSRRVGALKCKPQAQLEDAWVPGGCDLSKLGIIESSIHVLKLRVVEGIVSICAELKIDFTVAIEWEGLEERNIPVISSRQPNAVPACIPKRERGGQRINTLVEPLDASLRIRNVANKIWTRRHASTQSKVVDAKCGRDRKAALHRSDARDLPAAQSRPHKHLLCLCGKRKLVDVVR